MRSEEGVSGGSGVTGPPASSMLVEQWNSGCSSSENESPRVWAVLCARRCVVPGGIETLLKLAPSSSSGSASVLKEEVDSSASAVQPVDLLGGAGGAGGEYNSHEQHEEAFQQQQQQQQQVSAYDSGSPQGWGRGARSIAGRVMRGVRASTDKLERNLTGLAVRCAADNYSLNSNNTHNAHPNHNDVMHALAICYVSPPHNHKHKPNPNSFTQFAKTEFVPWKQGRRRRPTPQAEQLQPHAPALPHPKDEDETLWSIPLLLPKLTNPHHDQTIKVIVWIKIPTTVAFAPSNKLYSIGTSLFSLHALLHAQKAQKRFSSIMKPSNQGVLKEQTQPAMELYVLNNKKYPTLGGPGWSLTDPMPDACKPPSSIAPHNHHQNTNPILHNPPLEQIFAVRTIKEPTDTSYDYLQASPQPQDDFFSRRTILAIERTQESTVVLPLAAAVTRLLAQGAHTSSQHITHLLNTIASQRMQQDFIHDTLQAQAHHYSTPLDCSLDICSVVWFDPNLTGEAAAKYNASPTQTGWSHVSLHFQSPNCVWENDLGQGRIPLYHQSPARSAGTSNTRASPFFSATSLSIPFYPRGEKQRDNQKLRIGTVRFEITQEQVHPDYHQHQSPQNSTALTTTSNQLVALSPPSVPMSTPFGMYTPSVSTISGMVAPATKAVVPAINAIQQGGGAAAAALPGQAGGPVVYEAFVDLEPYLDARRTNSHAGGVPVEVPIYTPLAQGKRLVGTLMVTVAVKSIAVQPPSQSSTASPPVHQGLVNLLGMPSLTDGTSLDDATHSNTVNKTDAIPITNTTHGQQNQPWTLIIPPLGELLSLEWMRKHEQTRKQDAQTLYQRYQAYSSAIVNPEKEQATHAPHAWKCPASFRPSSSKMDPRLAGLPFNAHVQGLVVEPLDEEDADNQMNHGQKEVFWHNVTFGAAADHARGFTSSNAKPGGAGGARRLHFKREELAKVAQRARMDLRKGIRTYLEQRNATMTGGTQPNQDRQSGVVRHVPTRERFVQQLREAALRAEQNLVDVTWELATRKVNIWSQIIGVGMTSYLSALSDPRRATAQAADRWIKHGFLLCFEGLLSAAGKEHGMIEDVANAIEMLRMVQVSLVHASVTPPTVEQGRVDIAASRVIRWIHVGWNQPPPDSTQVVGPGLLIRVALDPSFHDNRVPQPLRNGSWVRFYPLLFQMGVDIRQWGANATSKFGNPMSMGDSNGNNHRGSATDLSALQDAEGEDADDVDAVPDSDFLTTLNYEAFRGLNHYAHTTQPVAKDNPTSAQLGVGPGGLPIHPVLAVLWGNVRDSARKMEHGVLDSAAVAGDRLGGSGIIFCKSGKDRTAMQATLKQAQFLSRAIPPASRGKSVSQTGLDQIVLADATLMRTHGTRLPICEKNVGQPKYAFNALQAKFMPEMLKPPLGSVAGFLKGGRLFTGGGIET